MPRDKIIRAASVGLILYGLLGFVLLLLAYVVASQTFAEIDALRRSLDDERTALVDSLRATSHTLDAAATTFDDFGGTLAEAQTSSAQAASFANELSGTMSQMSTAMGVQVLGFQPLAQLGGGFQRASQQLAALSGDLARTSQALGKNASDVKSVQANVAQAKAQVDQLARTFDAAAIPGTRPETARPLQLAIYGLLFWLAGQAAVSVALGVVLFNWSHRRIRALALPDGHETVSYCTLPERRRSV
jgi:DNA repair ATPase RecN